MEPPKPTQDALPETQKPAAADIHINRCHAEQELRGVVLPLGHGVKPSEGFFPLSSVVDPTAED